MKVFKPLIFPVFLIVILSSVLYFWDHILLFLDIETASQIAAIVKIYMIASLTFFIGWFSIVVTNAIFIDVFLKLRMGRSPPQILKSIIDIIIFVVFLFIIVGNILGKNLAALITGSGVAMVVVGFGIRSIISDYSNSIVINMDKPYNIGDWITVQDKNVNDFSGFVQEITWRTTRIQTWDKGIIVISNSRIGNLIIKNHTKNTQGMISISTEVCIDSAYEFDYIMNILETAIIAIPEFNHLPPSKASIIDINDRGITYSIRCSFALSNLSPGRAKDLAYRQILHFLRVEGIRLAHTKQDILISQDKALPEYNPLSTEDFIKRIPFFKILVKEEVDLIKHEIIEHPLIEGENLINENEEGDSMYIIKSGAFDVLVEVDTKRGKKTTCVTKLIPGNIVGEMSLLTGAPRTATVKALTDARVYEIKKATIEKIMNERPELADKISKLVAIRELETKKAKSDTTEAYMIKQNQSFINEITQRVKKFFNL